MCKGSRHRRCRKSAQMLGAFLLVGLGCVSYSSFAADGKFRIGFGEFNGYGFAPMPTLDAGYFIDGLSLHYQLELGTQAPDSLDSSYHRVRRFLIRKELWGGLFVEGGAALHRYRQGSTWGSWGSSYYRGSNEFDNGSYVGVGYQFRVFEDSLVKLSYNYDNFLKTSYWHIHYYPKLLTW